MNTKAMPFVLLGKEVLIVLLIATFANIFTSLTLLVETISSPEVIAALVSGGLTLALQFCRFWLRSRERRKSEAQAWRDELARLNTRLDQIAGKKDE